VSVFPGEAGREVETELVVERRRVAGYQMPQRFEVVRQSRTWRTCVDCAGSPLAHWLGCAEGDRGLVLLQAERPGRVVPPGYRWLAGAHQDDVGGVAPWEFPGAGDGRAEARQQLDAWRKALRDKGLRHVHGCCGVCGRSHAWPSGEDEKRTPPGLVRWGDRVGLPSGRRVHVCGPCETAGAACEWPNEKPYTVVHWAVAEAAGGPGAGLWPGSIDPVSIGFLLAVEHPRYVHRGAVPRGPWEYLGGDLARLRGWVARRQSEAATAEAARAAARARPPAGRLVLGG
jgi:hypothetical protein